jgi:hypothetical protein
VNRDDKPFIPQLSHSTTHRHPGHAILLGQLYLARQPRIRREPPRPDVPFDVPSDLGSHRNGRIVTYPIGSII